jgi:hypothetical protein
MGFAFAWVSETCGRSMTSKTTIRKQIESTVGGRYSDWQIGLTAEPVARKAKLGNPLNWLQWQADSQQSAREIREEFANKGMRPSSRTDKIGQWVFIFST